MSSSIAIKKAYKNDSPLARESVYWIYIYVDKENETKNHSKSSISANRTLRHVDPL